MKSSAITVRPVPLSIPSTGQKIETEINDTKVTIVSHDMTTIKADAYVVPQRRINPGPWGVPGAVVKAGARSGIRDYIIQSLVRQDPFDYGHVELTSSGGGNSQYLLNIVTQDLGDSENPRHGVNGVEQLALHNVLVLSSEIRLKSIVVPALGTGGDLTFEESAKAIKAAIEQSPTFENIVISTNNNPEAFKAFKKVFKKN